MRRYVRALFFLSFSAITVAQARGQGSCNTATLAPLFLRAEGQTELTGDVLIQCSGVTTGQSINLDLAVNAGAVPITSRTGEGLAVVSQAGSSITYLGSIVSTVASGTTNLMRFSGITVTDPSPAFLISGIRVNSNSPFVSLAGVPYVQLVDSIAASNGALPPIGTGPLGLVVGVVDPGLGGTVLSSSPTVDPCQSTITLPPGSTFNFTVPTNFPGALKSQGFAGNPPGSVDSESGPDINEPQANSATQLAVTLGGNLPAQFLFYLPGTITSDAGGIAQLVTAEGGSDVASPPANIVQVSIGTTVFYNVVASSSTQQQTFSLPLTTDPANATTFSVGDFSPTITIALAPFAVDLPGSAPSFQGNNGPTGFAFNTSNCSASPSSPSAHRR